MAKPRTKLIKPKKKWFTAVAPKIFKSAEVTEIAAFEPKNLVGRCIQVNMSQVTGVPKDQHKKLILKITDTRGEKALTEPKNYFLQEGFVQRASRRFKERVIAVKYLKTNDKKTIKVKLIILILNKLPRTLKSQLTKKLDSMLKEKISKTDSEHLFVPANLDKLTIDLKRELKQIYPVNRVLVWKLTLTA